MRYEYLPPYSPDYSPIELAFSAIKAEIRRNGNVIRALMENEKETFDVEVLLHRAVFSVSSSDAKGFFRRCGYI
jgi:hypothetical protein